MPKSLAKIEQQIKALEREAAQLRKKEAAGVVARIKEAIAYYDLSAQDLGLGSEPPGRRGAAARGSRRVRSEPRVRLANGSAQHDASAARRRHGSRAMYRDEHGNTWSGRGRRPGWLKDALASGKTLDDLKAS
ncbi:MAG: H-NS histone family protein [Burkholderiaceae bacterium]|nr:H-NS histone family protein [Burkholderiaceae bacterium]